MIDSKNVDFAGSGFMMLFLDPRDPLARYFVYTVVVSSLMMVWELGAPFKFRYSRSRDIGITVYLVLLHLDLPIATAIPSVRGMGIDRDSRQLFLSDRCSVSSDFSPHRWRRSICRCV